MKAMNIFMLMATVFCGLALVKCSNIKDEGDLWVPSFCIQYINENGDNLLTKDMHEIEITVTDENGTILLTQRDPKLFDGQIFLSINEPYLSNSDKKAKTKRYDISVRNLSFFQNSRIEHFSVSGEISYFAKYKEIMYNGQRMRSIYRSCWADPESALSLSNGVPTTLEISDNGAAPKIRFIIPL